MGVISEIVTCFSRKRIFGYTLHRRSSSLAIAVLGFLVWGHHMFVSGPVGLRGDGLLGPHASSSPSRRRSRSSTGPRRSTRARSRCETPMLYALGFIGLFTIGGLTGLFLGDARPRRPRARHLLRRRALPLHHGGRRDHGLPGRPALLVAEDHRPHVPRVVGARSRRCSSSSASTSRSSRSSSWATSGMPRRYHAYPRGVPGPERAVDGGRVDPGRRLPAPAGLPHLVAALRARSRRRNPVGRDGPRVADARRRRRPRTSRARRSSREEAYDYHRRRAAARDARRPPLADAAAHHAVRVAHHFDDAEQQREAVHARDVGVPRPGGACSSAACSRPTPSTATLYPEAFAAAQPPPRRGARQRQHRRPDRLSSLTMALAVCGAQIGQAPACCSAASLADRSLLGSVFLGRQGRYEYARQVRTSTWSRARTSRSAHEGAEARPRADLLLALLRDDRAARAAHDHRHRRSWLLDRATALARAASARSTTRRSRSSASTGTSSTSSGSSSSRCST